MKWLECLKPWTNDSDTVYTNWFFIRRKWMHSVWWGQLKLECFLLPVVSIIDDKVKILPLEIWKLNKKESRKRIYNKSKREMTFLFFLTFIHFWEAERNRTWAGEGQRERETQNLKQAPGSEPSAQTAQCGAWTHEMWDHDLCRSWPLNQPSHPGTPTLQRFVMFHISLGWSFDRGSTGQSFRY